MNNQMIDLRTLSVIFKGVVIDNDIIVSIFEGTTQVEGNILLLSDTSSLAAGRHNSLIF
jgi:hypothetical protein